MCVTVCSADVVMWCMQWVPLHALVDYFLCLEHEGEAERERERDRRTLQGYRFNLAAVVM